MKITLQLVFLSFFAFLFSCESVDIKEDLVQTVWEGETNTGNLREDQLAFLQQASGGTTFTLNFTDDNQFIMNYMGVVKKGTYTIDGRNITVTIQGEDQPVKYREDRLIMPSGDKDVIFTKRKE